MNKPVFKYSKIVYLASAILTLPLLIDICTACHLFSLWLAWLLFFAICIISAVRLWFAFSQKCYKFAWGLIAQILLGAGVLVFFQLSYNNVIETPVSHPVTPAVVDIAPPAIIDDSIGHDNKSAIDHNSKKTHSEKSHHKSEQHKADKN